MPSHKPLKTYEKRSRAQISNTSKSVDAINALFAENLSKRLRCRKKKAKLEVKELPPRTETYLTGDSLTVEPNSTFDKILKGKVYNEVKIDNLVRNNSSESDVSKSRIAQVSVSFHSPVMTRRQHKKASAVISELSDASKEGSAPLSKSSTLDKPVTDSLCIEIENKVVSVSSLSYIKLPKITENEVMSNDQVDTAYEPVFSATFRERQTVHSSTPCVTVPVRKIVADSISPITKSDSSNSSKLIEKSYDQIRKWDENFPNLDTGETPTGPSTRAGGKLGADVNGRRRKLSILIGEEPKRLCQDWKLSCQPKVYLKASDIIESRRTRSRSKKEQIVSDFRGFNREEQSCSSQESSEIQELLEEMDLIAKKKHIGEILIAESNNRRRKTTNGGKISLEIAKKQIVNKSRNSELPPSSVKIYNKRALRSCRARRSQRLRGQIIESSLVLKPTRFSSKSQKNRQVEKEKDEDSSEPKRSLRDKRPTSSAPRSPQIKRNSNKRSTVSLKRSPQREVNRKTSQRNSIKSCGTECLNSSPDENKGFITLRKRKVFFCSVSNRKKTDVASSSRKSKIKKSVQCINITDDILSEKEVSYSHSSNVSSVACSESSLGKRNYTTEELTQNAEVQLPKQRSKVLTVELKDFDDFMESYYSDQSNERSEKYESCAADESKRDSNQNSVTSDDSYITISDDSLFCDPIETGKIKFERVSSEKKVEDATQPSTVKRRDGLDESTSAMEAPARRSQRVTSPRIRPPKDSTPRRATEPAKITILSNVSLDRDRSVAKTYQNIWHDHSYSSPQPKLKQLLMHSTPNNNKRSVTTSTPMFAKNTSYLPDIVETSILSGNSRSETNKPRAVRQKAIKLKPGKSYRRSLSLLRRSSILLDVKNSGRCQADCVCMKCLFRRKLDQDVTARSSQIVPVASKSMNRSILETYARSSLSYVQEKEYRDLDDSIRGLSLSSRKSLIHNPPPVVTAKDVVLRRCGQTEVLPFEQCYPRSALQNCQKIGEGVYGEVFLYRNQNGGTSVMKVIPIEGDLIVNGERQKKFDEILSEIVIAMELSNLRNNKKNNTSGFSEVQKVRCTQGNYPDRLLDLWELYDETRGSENDSPQVFPSDQLYIVLELTNGGRDLESFVFNNALQAFAMFKQTACALAVAESQLKFEHRDLHWGNVLLTSVDKNKTLRYRLNDKDLEVETHGVEIAIIDFTLSRIEFDGVVIFNDLSLDNELFAAQGDYQFEIYRLMQKSNGNEWQHFESYSNILWLHYVLDKAITSALRYKNTKTKVHRQYLAKLKKYADDILSYHSVVEFVTENFM